MAKKGRPKLVFNIDQVRLFGKFRATYETMADWFECSTKTIQREMENNKDFCLAYKKEFANTKLKLAEAQIKTALDGNPTMLVWLGKQYLEQKEPKDIPETDNNWTTQMTIIGLNESAI